MSRPNLFSHKRCHWGVITSIVLFVPAWDLCLEPASYAKEPSTLPSAPIISDSESSAGEAISSQFAVKVRGFRFEGNMVITSKQLSDEAERILRQHPDGILSAENLEQIRIALTKLYVSSNYINSGAVLPDQTIGPDGIVMYKIVEGKLTHISVNRSSMGSMAGGMAGASTATTQPMTMAMAGMNHGAMAPFASSGEHHNQFGPGPNPAIAPAPKTTSLHLLKDSYIISRVRASAGSPLDVVKLKNGLEMLRDDPNIKTINAELKPGDAPGQSDLDLTVTERNPFQLGLRYANDRSPSVGAYHLDALASDSDLTGNGDSLSTHWTVLVGGADQMEFAEDHDYGIDYALPLTPNNLTLSLDYTRSSDLVVETPFSAVNITSKTDELAATLRQPLVRDPVHEFALFVTTSANYNRTYLLGEPFDFSPGAGDGVSDTYALRLGPEYWQKNQLNALALRATLSFGVDGAMTDVDEPEGPDSRLFFAFLGQMQYTRLLPLGPPEEPLSDTQVVFRFTTQLTPEPLLAPEQFSLGGVNTVRGYQENQLVTDNAINASVELHIPLAVSSGQPTISLVPFFDSGYAWDVKDAQSAEFINSAGLGLVFTPNHQIDARIYWGIPFKQFPHTTDDLQDMGLHFSITLLAF
ncbi:MAG TPA: ShlB/FhaC/HecB family hemolysin secretion/activation protein [Tepidisphaeraceae bacterium]